MMPRKSLRYQLFDRDIDAFLAADRVMSVIRHGDLGDVWRDDLMVAHFDMIYHYAHYENGRIDHAVKNASRVKPSGVAARIVEARELAQAKAAKAGA
jgi:hypothetical protein